MTFRADLHVHSKYSRATSRDLDLEHLAFWAARKGSHVSPLLVEADIVDLARRLIQINIPQGAFVLSL